MARDPRVRITHYTCSIRAAVQVGEVVELDWTDLPGWLFDHSANAPSAEKGAAGYVAAAPIVGQRNAANTGSTRVVALDWDKPGAPAFDPEQLEGLEYFAYTTDSHLVRCPDNPHAEPRWRVWLLLDREYSATEVSAAAAGVPWAGAVLRNISQPVFLPTKVESVEWVVPEAGRPWVLPVAKAAAEPPAPYVAPARVTKPSLASTHALAARWHTNESDTNHLAGAVGAVLGGAWGWSDTAITEYFGAWLQHPDSRHLRSALAAAATRRAGGHIQGFPELEKLLGQPFLAEAPAAQDTLWEELAQARPEAVNVGAATLLGARAWSAGEIAAWDPPPVPWLSEELCLAPGAPSIISGYGGTGKTTFVQHLALAVATPGQKLLGAFGVRHGAVLHIDHEQGQDLTRRRYLKLGIQAHAQLTLVSFPQWSLGDRAPEARLAFLRACGGKTLVVLDSLLASCVAFLENGENDSTIREPLDFLGRVSAATGATFLVIHHSKKDRADQMTAMRGSSALTDAVALHISYERPDLAVTTRPVLSLGKVRNERPARGLVEPVAVAQAPRGAPADGGYTLVAEDQQAREQARLEDLEGLVVEKLRGGWIGSGNQLCKELGKNRNDVLAAVAQLETALVVTRNSRGQLALV